MKILQPPGWAKPRGYANGIAAKGTQVFISGQIGWDAECHFVSDDLAAQAKQALANIVAVLAEAGGKPEHITRMTWYVTDKREYVAAYRGIGEAYREIIGKHFKGNRLLFDVSENVFAESSVITDSGFFHERRIGGHPADERILVHLE